MSEPVFALADTRTVGAFILAGEIRRRLGTAQLWRDAAGRPWLRLAGPQSWVGVSGAGPGEIYHPAAAADVVAACGSPPRPGDSAPGREEFATALHRLRLGPLLTRLLWAVHTAVLDQRVATPEFGFAELATRVWGRDRSVWPHHWRRDMRELLVSLTWLHRADCGPGDRPTFGPETVIAYQVTIGGDRLTDPAGSDARDARIRVFAGPALLGTLERLAKSEPTGLRTYDALATRKALKKVGESGQVQRVFLPALFPECAGLELTPARQQLFQALIRETTRVRQVGRARPRDAAEPEVRAGGVLRAYSGRGGVHCPALRSDTRYVGFNGNGRRAGMGYRPTAQGWLARCGRVYAL